MWRGLTYHATILNLNPIDMKRLFLALLSFIYTLCINAEEKSLIITFNDNTTQAFALAELPDILMENDKMIINAGNTTIEYDLYKVKTFTFGIPSGIDNTTIQDVLMNGNKLYIPGTNNKIRIFSRFCGWQTKWQLQAFDGSNSCGEYLPYRPVFSVLHQIICW